MNRFRDMRDGSKIVKIKDRLIYFIYFKVMYENLIVLVILHRNCG